MGYLYSAISKLRRRCFIKLIIAEKPSLAQKIINSIDKHGFARYDGYYENDEYIVTWAYGHLFSLMDVEEYESDYDPEEKYPWSFRNIPHFPSDFKFRLKKDKTKKTDPGIKQQFNVINKLVKRKDVKSIINAGDSDREGEIIVRIILSFCDDKSKKVYRLWLPNQTPETIKKQLKDLKDDKEYDNLSNEGYARTYVDWLFGINFTRYCSLKSGKLLRVGRVIAAIVEAIYERDMEIKNFVSEKYYNIISEEKTNGELIKLISKNTFKIAEHNNALELCKLYNSKQAIVDSVTTEKKEVSAGKLYSTSKLQGVLGEHYKMSPKETLSILQELYEAGYVTYPRTNTEYMAEKEKDSVKDILKVILSKGYPVKFKDKKSIFNDSKIESHSAITPTTIIPDVKTLTEKQQKVYSAILSRFVAVFCSEPCEVNHSEIKISIDDLETFTLNGDILLSKGWMKYDFASKKDKILPKLSKGDIININFKPVKKETVPPKHYTVKTLGNFLKNPLKKEEVESESEHDDSEDYKAILDGLEIGTEATRSDIIENAIKQKYISLKNNTYYIEPDGIYYVETLRKLKVVMNKYRTAQFNKLLKDVYKEKLQVEDVVKEAEKIIQEVFDANVMIEKYSDVKEGIGTCPLCDGKVIKTKIGYGCSNYKSGCKLVIPEKIAGKKISEAATKKLIENGLTNTIKGFTSSKGSSFDAKLKLEKDSNSQNGFKLSFVFPQHETPKISLKCPVCGEKIINDKYGWRCENKCGFSVNYEICHRKITEKMMNDLIQNGKTDLIPGFISKKGNKFSAYLTLMENKVKMTFPKN